jgi:hypothetical protein
MPPKKAKPDQGAGAGSWVTGQAGPLRFSMLPKVGALQLVDKMGWTFTHPREVGNMSVEKKANRVLELARQTAEQAESWADFSAALFDYSSGLVTKAFPDATERQAFFDTEQHEEINRMLVGLMKKFGVVVGSRQRKRAAGLLATDEKSEASTIEQRRRAGNG